MGKMTVAVIGANTDRTRYGNKSVRAHQMAGYEVYPISPSGGVIEGLTAYKSITDVPIAHLSRVTLYVRPEIVAGLLDDIAAKGCDELWFNPGTANPEVVARANALGLNAIEGCSIVDLNISPATL